MFDQAHSYLDSEHEAFGISGVEAPLRQRHAGVIEFNSVALLQGRREIVIRHGNELYRLRHTRNDKLILTK